MMSVAMYGVSILRCSAKRMENTCPVILHVSFLVAFPLYATSRARLIVQFKPQGDAQIVVGTAAVIDTDKTE